MPRQPTATQARMKNISKCVAITANTFDVLVTMLKISGLEAISKTIQSLLTLAQTIKQDKNESAELMEYTHEWLGRGARRISTLPSAGPLVKVGFRLSTRDYGYIGFILMSLSAFSAFWIIAGWVNWRKAFNRLAFRDGARICILSRLPSAPQQRMTFTLSDFKFYRRNIKASEPTSAWCYHGTT
ncbi:hypothetical protein B0H16DRAFT_1448107 [Mycena metata]|uniref:Uncharacterized protein n=1 Tax=Mycena metata TaxID=1033252 RepID=A0AAD7K950_9AGAR|nr:hypothetical protein B0H16DRAFT_1448107 [Mycena metata]